MDQLIKSLIALSGQEGVIVIRKPFVRFAGSLEAGLLLGQLLYWTPRARIPGQWIAKTDADFSDELCLSSYAVRKARKLLEDREILQTTVRKFAGNPTVHYRLDLDELQKQWVGWLSQMDIVDSQERSCENAKTLTETTTEITTLPDFEKKSKTPDTDWIEALENSPAPPRMTTPPGMTPEEYQLQRTRAASVRGAAKRANEPWRAWGTQSPTVTNWRREDVPLAAIQKAGYLIETQFGLAPLWGNQARVKAWLAQLATLYQVARGDMSAIKQAGIKLRANGMTIKGPASLEGTVIDMLARRRTSGGVTSPSDGFTNLTAQRLGTAG